MVIQKSLLVYLVFASPSDVEVLSPLDELDGHLKNAVIQGNEVGGPITVTAMAEDIVGAPIDTSAVTGPQFGAGFQNT